MRKELITWRPAPSSTVSWPSGEPPQSPDPSTPSLGPPPLFSRLAAADSEAHHPRSLHHPHGAGRERGAEWVPPTYLGVGSSSSSLLLSTGRNGRLENRKKKTALGSGEIAQPLQTNTARAKYSKIFGCQTVRDRFNEELKIKVLVV